MALARLSQRKVVVDRPAEVARYLSKRPRLVETVQKVSLAATDRFGERAQISLELQPDPEYRHDLLTLFVRQSPYDDDLLTKLDEIAEDQDPDSAEWVEEFQLTTDFQPPR